ncbi:FHA domain-containing protein FhaB/FipA [Angustibacter sp. McL0619]|uniref:FHA domain-containing protein FhaB/FipA n=1 Tax=Angustibacter sp. McL0619 TaxID=3415676 RepID=UPI003CFA25FB
MSELTVTIIRLGLLAVLWVFVFSVVGVLRGDLFGTRVTQRPAPAQAPRKEPAPPKAPKAPKANRRTPSHVLVTEGPLKGTTISLGQQSVLIGRNLGSTVVLEDDYASGRHARIYPQDGEWFVEDLDSTNGTFLGNDKLTAPRQLSVGSTLRIGTTVLELRR